MAQTTENFSSSQPDDASFSTNCDDQVISHNMLLSQSILCDKENEPSSSLMSQPLEEDLWKLQVGVSDQEEQAGKNNNQPTNDNDLADNLSEASTQVFDADSFKCLSPCSSCSSLSSLSFPNDKSVDEAETNDMTWQNMEHAEQTVEPPRQRGRGRERVARRLMFSPRRHDDVFIRRLATTRGNYNCPICGVWRGTLRGYLRHRRIACLARRGRSASSIN